MPLPGFLCIGAQKAGTSWLNTQLDAHPQIWLPPIKELQYFSHLFVENHRNWTRWHINNSVERALRWHISNTSKVDFSYIRYLTNLATQDVFTENWYRAAFDRPIASGRLLGDITPEYSTIPDEGIHYLRGLLGNVKIIYLIRDPVTRAMSQLRMNVTRKQTDQKLSNDEWSAMAKRPEIVNRGDYRSYVPRWKSHFADEDILFLPYGRIKNDPEGLLREVEVFLNLEPHVYPRMNERIHQTEKVKVPKIVKEIIEPLMSEQVEFIKTEFGEDFASRT